MNTNDTEKLKKTIPGCFRLSFDACSVKALIHYYAGSFIFVVRIILLTSSGNVLNTVESLPMLNVLGVIFAA